MSTPFLNKRPLVTPNAGYGLVYLLDCAVQDKKGELKEKKILISGSGKVAIAAAEKCIELGATVLSLSDSSGTIFEVGHRPKPLLRC